MKTVFQRIALGEPVTRDELLKIKVEIEAAPPKNQATMLAMVIAETAVDADLPSEVVFERYLDALAIASADKG